MSEEEEKVYKTVLLVEMGVGKTCIIAQFINNSFDPDSITTSSMQFSKKIIEFPDNKSVNFHIYDTAGQESFRSMARIFYKSAQVVLLVYDITRLKSFQEIKEYWYNEVKQICDKNIILAIVANKNDLYERRQVEDEEGEKFAKNIGAIFASTSAKDDMGITALFENIGQYILNPKREKIDKRNTFSITTRKTFGNIEEFKEKRRKRCCFI